MEKEITTKIIAEYIKERQLIYEGWGDVAGSVLQGAAGAVNKNAQSKARNAEVLKTQAKIKTVKAALAKCGDSKWCKVKKHAQLVALGNHLEDLRRKRGYK